MRGATIVFDLDGTLIDTAPDLIAATQHVLARAGLARADEHRLRARIGFGARAMIVEALDFCGADRSEQHIDEMLAEFLLHYSANIARFSRPFPGCLAVLNALRGEGVKLAVCTNKREDLTLKLLGELNVTEYFDGIAGRDTFPVSKPDPGHLTGAIELAGGSCEHALMVGDSTVDVRAARGAGVPIITVDFGYPDKAIDELGGDRLIGHYDAFIGHARDLLGRT